MLLTKNQFDKKFKNNELKLAFIGMSNIGKSFRAKELETSKNFFCKSIDDDICKEIGIEENIEKLAAWLGFPFDAEFEKKQNQYLKIENYLTKNIIIPDNRNVVIDTTGSSIYLSAETHQFLKNNFLVIHFKVPENFLDKMIKKYFELPKAIIWGDLFNKSEEETNKEALKRCYPKLLEFRTKKYQELADISINFFRDEPMTHNEFWETLRTNL